MIQRSQSKAEYSAMGSAEDNTDRAISILKAWVLQKRQLAATEQTIAQLNDLSDIDIFKVLEGLQQSKKYFQGMKGNQLDLSVKI